VRQPLLLAAALLGAVAPLSAQSSAPAITLSGYVQPQFERVVLREGTEPTDHALLRRAVLTVDAAPLAGWSGRVQVDLGPLTTRNDILLRDAYLRYTGWASRGLTVTIGNQKLPYSRSYLVPAMRRGLIERPVTGTRSLGTPGRSLSVKLDGRIATIWQWSAAVASTLHDPDIAVVHLDGVAESAADWNEGVLAAGRVELHPLGPMAAGQGDFGGPPRVMLALGGYTWTNDGDRDTYTSGGRSTSATHADLDHARALEASAAFRGHRLSVDAEYHHLTGRTVDPAFTGGVYRAGAVAMDAFSVEGGVMIVARRLEALAMIDGLAVGAHDATAYGPAFGAAYYFAGHDLKLSLMHRYTVNVQGTAGVGAHATSAQAQIVF
jgi:hypothetical protein